VSAAMERVAIVVAHGSLARGLVSAMEKVLGPQPNVFWISNTGLAPEALQARIESLVAAEAPDKEVYLLTDLRGGSCATSALRCARMPGVRGIFFGANLTLLLEFILLQELPRVEFFQALLAKARASVEGLDLVDGERGAGEARGGPGELTEPRERRASAVP
jgi:PTS system mannose-specific IIA component